MGCTPSVQGKKAAVAEEAHNPKAAVVLTGLPTPTPPPAAVVRRQAVLSPEPKPAENPRLSDIFKPSDFTSRAAAPGPAGAPGDGHVKSASSRRLSNWRKRCSGDSFAFGDFEVEVESQLEEKIMENYKAMADFSVDRGYKFPAGGASLLETPQDFNGVLHNYDMFNLVGHAARVKCVALCPNERLLASCSHEDLSISIYDLSCNQEIATFFGHEDAILNACFSADGKFLATASRDKSMILWDATTGKLLFAFEHDMVVICCAFSYDARYLVSGCQDMVCRVWDVRKRRELLSFCAHEGIIVSVAWSPTDYVVASTSSDKSIRLWHGKSGHCLRTLRGHMGVVLACSWHSNGSLLVSNEEALLKVWDTQSGHCLRTVDTSLVAVGTGRTVAWTLVSYGPGPFGAYIVAVANDRSVHILEAKTGADVLALYTRAAVYCLAAGTQNKIAFGDSYGNIYIVELV